MILVNVYEGFVSEIRAYFLAYRLAVVHQDDFVLDLSQFYQGSFWTYHLDYLRIPDVRKIVYRGFDKKEFFKVKYGKEIVVIENGMELEKIHCIYDKRKLYYIINDSYMYDDFFDLHSEYFFRYIGSDIVTKNLFSMLELNTCSEDMAAFMRELKEKTTTSVGIHIRLGDFFNVGWIVEEDFAFFRAAVQWFREKENSPEFYVFSDDICMAEEILGKAKDIKYIHFPFSFQSDIEELICLALCDHRILDKKSTYGLFAETIAQNKYGKDGMTLILKERHFQNDAGNRDYVEKAVNTDNGPNKKMYFGCYKELSSEEVALYDDRYNIISAGVPEYVSNTVESNLKKGLVVFAVRQTYMKAMPRGMEYLAHYMSKLNYSVHFIGIKGECLSDETKCMDWVFENSVLEHGLNSLVSDICLYSYEVLNTERLYTEFIGRLKNERDCESAIVIVRKAIALPPISQHGQDKYVFIDFSDRFDEEAVKCISEYSVQEINYLYENSDIIITFDRDIQKKWANMGKENVWYIDLEKIYPQFFICENNKAPEILRTALDNYCENILKTILKNYERSGKR